jgi:tRNA(fMet)-specific endonuclease VapC
VNFLFDTNALIHLMKVHEPLVTRARQEAPSCIAVSSITLAELWYGAARSQRPQRSRVEQDAALAPFRVLDFDAESANHYASLRSSLEKVGKPIGDRDLLIASIALANHLSLVTSNTAEFMRVPGLSVEDWMRSAER